MKRNTTKRDLYQEVTDQLLAAMETAQGSWQSPWCTGAVVPSTPRKHDGKPYQGINTLVLWSAATLHGYTSPYWMTYNQAKKFADGQVRKGEKGQLSIFFKPIQIKDTDENGEEIDKQIALIRGYTVFNADQIDGLPDKYYSKPVEPFENKEARDRIVDTFVDNTGATINHGGNRAFFAPGPDRIQMPEFKHFKDSESYYSTLLHELTHWTGHNSRLDRLRHQSFGDTEYAFEELVAEIGSAFLCADLGLSLQPREDHAQYLNSWIKALKSDKKHIFRAASKAQKAAALLNSYQDVAVIAA